MNQRQSDSPVGQATTQDSTSKRAISAPRIVVVGPCASGKSTLVNGLRAAGYLADVAGQEHSDIPSLWNHSDPDLLVVLDVDLETIRGRRQNEHWPDWLLERQLARLQDAVTRADFRIDTSHLNANRVLELVLLWLAGFQRR